MSTKIETVGFVGAGLMGHGMAKNVVEAGYGLAVLGHRNREPIEDLVGRGAREASDLADLARTSDCIVFCLPGSPKVEETVDALLAAEDRRFSAIVDSSTANPVSTRDLAERCRQAGIAYVDAPLSRTPKEAWAGELDVMAGGETEDFERVKPILETFAGKILHVGPVGAGHTMKLLNNFISMGYGALYSEALAIGAKNGVDAETMQAVLSGGRMDCGFFQTFMQYVVGGDENAHKFALRNAHKDMRYVVGLANESGIASHISSAVKNSFAMAEATGHGERYLPMLADVVADLNGVPRRKRRGG